MAIGVNISDFLRISPNVGECSICTVVEIHSIFTKSGVNEAAAYIGGRVSRMEEYKTNRTRSSFLTISRIRSLR